ncbi:hypothetical protein CC85DRAFT_303776 [Cutaneotrichosporon oleaginosum]|uniref:Transcription factor domain-containing protein n=1 Tax=Cutaneotrichosporon oleaginosum TaxID=879819 RepID=A0A0J0XIK8_9TREE|nr:uncharacterized protein CC85DRAFT_303776 [Cutaneotrichosporon oleaginosum]KLT40887.1 hypothetical protein CC85DRAFT_303776 [Cutaneotrichosporon oleaginosum]TXT09254.1 hypothetical protein COLE_03188 [Cutaneotrichosporon oleaginosum]
MFELPPKRKRGRSPGTDARPSGVHKRGKRIVSLLATLQRADEPEDDAQAPALLGVPGLTRQALDGCVVAFFGGPHHTLRLSQPADIFARRVRVMLYETAGLEVPKDLTGIEASSELLALAVAALGAGGADGAAPALEVALRERCLDLLTDAEYLAEPSRSVDAVEAANLLAETGPHATGISHLGANPLTLDARGRAYPPELALYHGLNMPRPSTAAGADERRREDVFWAVWAADALRATCVGAQAALADTDVGWRHPPDDGVVPLARAARLISARLLSARARCTGLRNEDVRAAIAALDALARATPADLAWLRATQDPAAPATMAALAARNTLYIVCWAAARADAAQHPRKLSARTLEAAEAGALHGADDMLALARTAVERRLPVPPVVAARCVAAAVFLIHRVAEDTHKARPGRAGLVGNAEALVKSIAGMASCPDTPSVVAALRDALAAAQAPDAQPALVADLVGVLAQHGVQTPFGALEI